MTTPNFASILDEAPTEIVRPKPLPPGTYLFVVAGAPEYGKSSKKGTDFVEFTLKPIAAEADVDDDDLAAAGGLDNKSIKTQFYITTDAIFRLDMFHEHCGLDLHTAESRKSRNADVVNTQVRGVIINEVSAKNNETVYAKLARTLKAD